MKITYMINGFILFALLATSACKKEPIEQMIEQVNAQKDSTTINGSVVINVTGFKSTKGVLNVALFNTSSTFNTDVAYKTQIISVTATNMQARFDSIPPGTYAFALFHDENINSKIDKNGLGIPNEGFAFSNNAMGTFGPPDFDKSKFVLPEKSVLTQTIRLKFY